MNFKFVTKPEIYELFPEAKIAGLLISGLKKKSFPAGAIATIINNQLELTSRISSTIKLRKEIRDWTRVIEKIGLNSKEVIPAHTALINRVLKQRRLPSINPIVDLYNIISIRNIIPIGGHDLTSRNEITLGHTSGKEQYQGMGQEGPEKIAADEFAYLDERNNQVLTRHLIWRQSDFSKITEASHDIFLPIDDIPGIRSFKELEMIANELIELMSAFYDFDWAFGIVNKYNPTLELRSTPQKISGTKLDILLKKPQIDTSEESINKFFDRKLDLIYPDKESFVKALRSGNQLSFYIGADATGPRLHLGHIIPVTKMRQLQKMGHRVIFLIGDFTARIGDPTDKTAARVMLTEEQIAENAIYFKSQIARYIDFEDERNPAGLVFNSFWNSNLKLGDVISLASNFTVQQMIERDMFQTRLKENKPIYLHEFLYPLIQGYDSVYMQIDGEFGGRDQTFNMLAGRNLSKNLLGIDKFVITTHFLLSEDGKNKMSKSIGNCIFIDDTAEQKFIKVMSIPDNMIEHYYQMATDKTDEEITEITARLNSGADPMQIKKDLAYEIVRLNDGTKSAKQARTYFEKTIQNNEVPEGIKTVPVSEAAGGGKLDLKTVMVKYKLAPSNSEAKRLIRSGAVEVNQQKITELDQQLDATINNVIKVGKKLWLKITP